MAVYYKGTIVLYSELDNEWEFEYYGKISNMFSENERRSIYFTLEKIRKGEELTVLDINLIKILDNRLKYILKNIVFKSVVMRPLEVNIIFEIVQDIDGNKYAKEVHTNLIFPIITNENEKHTYIFKEKNIGRSLSSSNIILCINWEHSFPLMDKVESVVSDISICDKNEIDKYLNMFDKGLLKSKKKKDFLKILKTLYNKNIFKELFKVKEEVKKEKVIRVSKSVGTNIMENIEYLLLGLKNNNQELYIKYKEKYESLLSNPNLNYQVLAMFEGEIEASLLFGMNGVHEILAYLTNLKKEYLDNFFNNKKEKTDLTFEKINKINELFLKVKDKYNLLNQREVLKDLAFLYLMEVYENKDNINIEELEDTYFADNLKNIVICIKSLQEIGLIECNYLIDLVSELSCNIVFDMIKCVKFNKVKQEKVKELVKGI